jgi:ABC-2 type transport system permease protein
MKQYLPLVKKEFRQLFQDKKSLTLLLIIPVLLIFLFGFSVSTDIKGTRVAILNPSIDIVTEHIVEMFRMNKYFTINQKLTSISQIDEAFKKDEVDLVIVFSENFANDMVHFGDANIQLIADGTDNQAAMRVSYAERLLGDYQRELMLSGGNKPMYQIVPEMKMLYNPHQRGDFNIVPGSISLILLLITALMCCLTIVKEKEKGTMEMLLSLPVSKVTIILAKATPYFILSCLNLLVILLISVFFIQIPIMGSVLGLICISILYILVAISLGMLISTIADCQLSALLVAGMVLLGLSILLSGLMFPIDSMPKWLQYIADIIPARWFGDAVRKIMIQGVEFHYVIKEMLVLILMFLICFGATVKKFKLRLG